MINVLDSTSRSVHRIPSWLVKGMKLYFLEVRSHFMNSQGVTTMTRRFVDDPNAVITEPLFVNSSGNTVFRVKGIADQYTAIVEAQIKNPHATLLKRHVANIMPFSTDPSIEHPKMKVQAKLIFEVIDGYEFKEVYKATRARQDQQKYLKQNIRADIFMQQPNSQSMVNIDHRISSLYTKMKWDTTDLKKVKHLIIILCV